MENTAQITGIAKHRFPAGKKDAVSLRQVLTNRAVWNRIIRETFVYPGNMK